MITKQLKQTLLVFIILTSSTAFSNAQEKKVKATWGEGVVVAGYVDKGAYLNFAGPALKFSGNSVAVLAGLLPSLRFKEDKSESGTKNSLVTSALGFGLTGVYKHLAVQVPFFYNPKTVVNDGKWNVGVGVGYKF